MPKAPRSRLASRNGPSIHRTDAGKAYGLDSSDLGDSILPVSDGPNPRDSTTRMKTYNVSDVEALSRHSKSNASRTSQLAAANGPSIMRTTAMKRFQLVSSQMDRLVPVRTAPNRHANAKGPTRYYNLCDVQALANSVAAAAASPIRNPAPRASYDSDGDDHNIFDGMPGEDAAFLLARLTGIMGPAMAYSQ